MKPKPAVMTLALLLAGCRYKVIPEPDFERMVRQEKLVLWEGTDLFPDGRVVQSPPEGTVPVERVLSPGGLATGMADGAYVAEIPVPLEVPLVQRGRQRFETFCAPCHGILGDGSSRVAASMTRRSPPSLVGPAASSLPAGRIFQVITDGYGLMPRYAEELPSIEDRWAVVAYLRALELRRSVPLGALPPALRARAEEALR
jgi:mono/diheme cytochrome c family protein